MKKILFVLVMILFVAGVQAEELEYKEDKLVAIDGDVTLNFDWSTNDNADDIQMFKLLYSSEYNLTIYKVESKTISYDFTFVNDTKYYYYDVTNSTEDYIISIDYSSIEVPSSPYQDLLNVLKEKNETINLTVEQLSSMTKNYTYEKELSTNWSQDFEILENKSDNQTVEIAVLTGSVTIHQDILKDKNLTIGELENPFNHLPWIGLGFFAGIVVLFLITGKGRTIIRDNVRVPVIKKEVEDIPKEERKFLNIEEEVDKIVESGVHPSSPPT